MKLVHDVRHSWGPKALRLCWRECGVVTSSGLGACKMVGWSAFSDRPLSPDGEMHYWRAASNIFHIGCDFAPQQGCGTGNTCACV